MVEFIKKNWIAIVVIAVALYLVIHFNEKAKAKAEAAELKLRAILAKYRSESDFAGPFTETKGLNVLDYGMGLEGLSLLEDKDLKESNFQQGPRQGTPRPTTKLVCKFPDGSPCHRGDEHCKCKNVAI